ncbi:MAG: hypothetical protein IIA83_12225, partial [Thaumarchaeota archaeon]|nr:hypothetical protein [Nitrososphaerota archaeon]
DERRFKIPNFRFPSTPEFDSLRTDGIIVDTENFIQFFHQIYFDFIMSMIIIEKGRISEFLINIGNETFLRSTIRFTLSYLHDQDLDRYLENIRSLLTTTEVDDYWKNVTIGFIANLQNVSENERGLFEELLNGDSDLQKYFFDSVIEQKNPYWYTIWKDTLFDQWSSDGEFKHSVLFTDYIKKSVEWLS